MTMKNISVPRPTVKEVEKYLRRWNNLKDYKAQEDALDKLFFKLCPQNVDESDILLKVASLNDFYSTNIFSVFPVAERILKCVNVDERLNKGDETLVMDIQKVSFIKEKTKEKVNRYFYSFATKYCSHHRPLLYPIYDSYVDAVLRYFRNRDSFESAPRGSRGPSMFLMGQGSQYERDIGLSSYITTHLGIKWDNMQSPTPLLP